MKCKIDWLDIPMYPAQVSITTENYLKQIFVASEGTTEELVSLGELATSLNVTPGTVTTMMKSLAGAGLVVYRPRAGVMLTKAGREAAIAVVRRHRIVELFLVEILGLDWSDVHAEAEDLEHAISDRLLGRIDELLGHPTTDPHGDPIPGPDGSMSEMSGILLSEVNAPAEVTVTRVDHQDASFLVFLKAAGLMPGSRATLVSRAEVTDTLVVETETGQHTIGFAAARKLRVSIS